MCDHASTSLAAVPPGVEAEDVAAGDHAAAARAAHNPLVV